MTVKRQLLITMALASPLLALAPSSPAMASVEAKTSECVELAGAAEGDTAIVNITPTRADGTGYGTVRAEGSAAMHVRPEEDRYSSVNFADGTPPNPNLAVVTVGTGGRICYDSGVADHDVIIDLAALIPAGIVDPADPTRLFDTRANSGGAIMAPNTSLCLSVPGAAEGDTAVVNITPVQAQGTGFGSLRARGVTPIYDRAAGDRYSSVNFASGAPANPNLSFVSVGPAGEVCYDGGGAFHHVILDLAATIPADAVKPSEPRRAIDTRDTSLVQPGTSVCAVVPGAEPGDVAVVNVTPVQARGVGFGALYAGGTTPVTDRPADQRYSSVNFAPNTPANPNLGMVEVGADGTVCYNGAGAAHHVILDIASVVTAASITAMTPTRVIDTRGPAGSIPIEVEVRFSNGDPVFDVYPDYPIGGFGVAHRGHTENTTHDQGAGSVDVGTVRGYIVDNGDGTISGMGVLEDRWGSFLNSRSRLDSFDEGFVTVYETYYEGFGVQCPETNGDEPPPQFIFQSHLPVTFSGTSTTRFGMTTYQISMSAGVGAQPGVAGGMPEIEIINDTLDGCPAAYTYCEEEVVSTQACGERGLETADLVLADRDQFVIDHLRITETLIENFNITTVPNFIRVAENNEFQSGAANNENVSLRIRLGY